MSPAYIYSALVKRVVDGDTIDADVDLGFGVWRHNERLRLLDVHAPEMSGTDRPEGIKAKNLLVGWLAGRAVTIATTKDKTDKYGRMLADIFLPDGRNVNQLMRDGAPVGGK